MIRFGMAVQVGLLALVMGAIGAAIGTGITTIVSAHGGDQGLIHACVQQQPAPSAGGTWSSRSGGSSSIGANVRIVDPNANCLASETALDWPKTGGATGYEVVFEQGMTSGAAGTTFPVRAPCPDDKQVLGGGGSSNESAWVLIASNPVMFEGGQFRRWDVAFLNTGPDTGDVTFNAYAICAFVTP